MKIVVQFETRKQGLGEFSHCEARLVSIKQTES